MKFKYVILVIFILIALIVINYTPNIIIKLLFPKRYLFNALTNTACLIYTECCENNSDINNTNFDFSVTKNSKKFLGFIFYSDNDKEIFSSDELSDGKILGSNNNKDIIDKYFSAENIYNKCFEVSYIGDKAIGAESGMLNTNEFLLRLKKEEVKKIINELKIDSKSLEVTNKFIDKIENPTITALVDPKHRVVGLKFQLNYMDSTYYIDLISNSEIAVNNIEFTFNKKDDRDNLTVTIKSKGNHIKENGILTDSTNISVLYDYIKAANLNLNTIVNYKKENIKIEVTGKVLKDPIIVNANGNITENGFSFKLKNQDQDTYEIILKSDSDVESFDYDEIWDNENNISKIINNLYLFLKKDFTAMLGIKGV